MAIVLKTRVITVTTAGTPVPLLTSAQDQTAIIGVIIQAQTNVIYVGDSTVLASTTTGHKLTAGTAGADTLAFPNGGDGNLVDLAKIYLDATVNGSKANLTYLQRIR